MVTAMKLQHDLLLWATGLFGVNLICFSEAFSGSQWAEHESSDRFSRCLVPAGKSCSGSEVLKPQRIFCVNSPIWAVPTFPCASIPFLGEGPWGSPQLCFEGAEQSPLQISAAPGLPQITVTPFHKLCPYEQLENKPQLRAIKSPETFFLGLQEVQAAAVTSHLSSLSQKSVINNFSGDNFICIFILKHRGLSPREVPSDIWCGILKLRKDCSVVCNLL